MEAIALRLEAIAIRLEAITGRARWPRYATFHHSVRQGGTQILWFQKEDLKSNLQVVRTISSTPPKGPRACGSLCEASGSTTSETLEFQMPGNLVVVVLRWFVLGWTFVVYKRKIKGRQGERSDYVSKIIQSGARTRVPLQTHW